MTERTGQWKYTHLLDSSSSDDEDGDGGSSLVALALTSHTESPSVNIVVQEEGKEVNSFTVRTNRKAPRILCVRYTDIGDSILVGYQLIAPRVNPVLAKTLSNLNAVRPSELFYNVFDKWSVYGDPYAEGRDVRYSRLQYANIGVDSRGNSVLQYLVNSVLRVFCTSIEDAIKDLITPIPDTHGYRLGYSNRVLDRLGAGEESSLHLKASLWDMDRVTQDPSRLTCEGSTGDDVRIIEDVNGKRWLCVFSGYW